MSRERECRPSVGAGRHGISRGDKTSVADGTSILPEFDYSLPFGDSLYADVSDMGDFIRLTIRNAAAHIDVKKHRMGVSA